MISSLVWLDRSQNVCCFERIGSLEVDVFNLRKPYHFVVIEDLINSPPFPFLGQLQGPMIPLARLSLYHEIRIFDLKRRRRRARRKCNSRFCSWFARIFAMAILGKLGLSVEDPELRDFHFDFIIVNRKRKLSWFYIRQLQWAVNECSHCHRNVTTEHGYQIRQQ